MTSIAANYIYTFLFLRSLRPPMISILSVVSAYFALLICDLGGVWLISWLVSNLLQGTLDPRADLILLVFFALLLRMLFAVWANYQVNVFSQNLMITSRTLILEKLFQNTSRGRSAFLASTALDKTVRQLQFVFSSVLEPSIRSGFDFCILTVLACYVLWLEPMLIVIGVIALVPVFIFEILLKRRLRTWGAQQVSGYERMTQWIQAAVASHRELRGLKRLANVYKNIEALGIYVGGAYSKASAAVAAPRYLVEFGVLIGGSSLLFAVSLFDPATESHMSQLFAALGFVGLRAIPLMNSVMLARNQFHFGKMSLLRAWALSCKSGDHYRRVFNDSNPVEISSLNLKALKFTIPDGRVITVPDFAIRGGEIALLKGQSGVGKTSLAEKICGFGVFVSGEISINGQWLDVQHWPSFVENTEILYFLQSAPLLPTSTADNLGVADTDEALLLLKKLDLSHLNPSGSVTGLSGGETARLRLLRIIAKKPEHALIILDEPTAALDAKSALLVMDAIRGLASRDNIIFIISHDLMFTEHVDQVISLQR